MVDGAAKLRPRAAVIQPNRGRLSETSTSGTDFLTVMIPEPYVNRDYEREQYKQEKYLFDH
jgi:hypothetical protein